MNGEKFREIRKSLNLSQKDIADRFERSERTISRLETGGAVPKIFELAIIGLFERESASEHDNG